jgi:hypothetical protein
MVLRFSQTTVDAKRRDAPADKPLVFQPISLQRKLRLAWGEISLLLNASNMQ